MLLYIKKYCYQIVDDLVGMIDKHSIQASIFNANDVSVYIFFGNNISMAQINLQGESLNH